MKLIKAILSDILIFYERIISYCYWNFKGVRITFLCQVSRKAKIESGCLFTGNSIITENASVGSFTYGHNVNINNATIGEYCSLAPDVKIGLDEHPLDKESTHPHFYKKIIQKKSIISNHVWIGANAIILCDVIVGSHSVIAAGAVVTKNVDEKTIVGGIPSRVINTIRNN
jgi:acetyltransferase-like isoleucine patch superfamily enzyme